MERNAARAVLNGSAEQSGLQVPVAEHRGGRTEDAGIDNRDPGPARLGVDPLERLMLVIVRHRSDRGFGFGDQPHDQVYRRRDPIADQQDR